MSPNYYEILGIKETATFEQIKSVYRRLSMIYHPDQNKDLPGGEDHLKKINEAYEVLGDPEKRAIYDNQLNEEKLAQDAEMNYLKNTSRNEPNESAYKNDFNEELKMLARNIFR